MTSLETIVPIRAHIPKLETYLDGLANGTEFSLSYLPRLNRLLCGLERRKLVVIGSRPSEGKSTFSLQMAYELSNRFKVIYLSLEMTTEEAMFRMYCYEERLPNTNFYYGFKDRSNKTIDNFKNKLASTRRSLIFAEQIGKSWEEIDRLFDALSSDLPDIVILDYIQCIKGNGKKLEVIEDYIKRFRALSIEKNFCLIICSQINRQNISDNKDKSPTMEGLKNTGFLEEHADKVILLHYPFKHNKNIDMNKYSIIVAKNKNGMTGYVDCSIQPDIYRIHEEVTPQKERNFSGND